MWPVLISLGPIKIYSYALAFLVALTFFFFVVWKKGREMHFDEDDLFDTTMKVLLWTIAGGRLTYIFLVQFKSFGINPFHWLSFLTRPGLWIPGAMAAAAFAIWHYSRKFHWDFFVLTDLILLSYTLYQSIMAFGRFLNGSGYGIASSTFGLRFGGMVEKHVPIQLFETILYAGLFTFLIWSENHYRTFNWYKGTRSEAQTGYVTAMYLIISGIISMILVPVSIPTLKWFGINGDPFIALIFTGLGGYLLYSRSAISSGRKTKDWYSRRTDIYSNQQSVGQSSNGNRWGNDIFN